MPTITQTLNLNAVWNGTIPFDADPAVSDFNLYAAQSVDADQHFRLVKKITNTGPGPIVLGPLNYAQLFLIQPTRKFFLRTTTIRNGHEDDLAAAPTLLVNPSPTIGWTREQLLENNIRPYLIVGFDQVNNLYYPICVEETDPGKFCLATNATATIAPGDIQIGAVEIKDHTTDDRTRVKQVSGLPAGEFAQATYDTFNIATEDFSAAATNLSIVTTTAARNAATILFRRTTAEAITLTIGIRDTANAIDYPIITETAFTGLTASLFNVLLDATSELFLITTGASAGTLNARAIKKIFP